MGTIQAKWLESRGRPLLERIFSALIALIVLSTSQAANAGNDPQFDSAVKLFNQKQYSAAIPILAKIIARPKPGPTAIYYAGLCYQNLGNDSMARQCYQVLADSFPTSAEARMSQEVLARLQRHQAGASRSFQSTVNAGLSEGGRATVPASDPGKLDAQSATAYMREFSMSDREWKSLPDEVKVPFRRATSSHLFVNGSINGRAMQMMFDTGAEQCHFSKKELESLGIKIGDSGARIPVRGVGGISYSQMIMADITIGDLRRHIPVLVDEDSVGMPIVGETFFKEFRYDIDNSSGFIRFSKKSRGGMASKVYESTDVIAIPYKNVGDNMVVMAKVNGREFPMIFDTGSFAICFSAGQAMALGLRIPSDARRMTTSGAGGSVGAYEFNIDRIELGPLIKTSVKIIVNESNSPPMPLLGQPFYSDRRFTVDTEKHLIKFAH